jgi:hypothetical protein
VPCLLGRSAILRTYRLWTRREGRPHTRQGAEGATGATERSTQLRWTDSYSCFKAFGMRSDSARTRCSFSCDPPGSYPGAHSLRARQSPYVGCPPRPRARRTASARRHGKPLLLHFATLCRHLTLAPAGLGGET